MDEPDVDFSEIRGDWYFHMAFLVNGMNHTLSRAGKLWAQVGSEVDDDEIGRLVSQQAALWTQISGAADERGAIRTDGELLTEFIEMCRSTKAPLDAMEQARGATGSSSIYDSTLEQFTEACRQARGFCDDLEMMREQRPD
jgi:hypothetical protein